MEVLYCAVIDIIKIKVIYCFFFQAEDGIRDLVRSRGLGDVYKRQERTLRLKVRERVVEMRAVDIGNEVDVRAIVIGLELSLIHI